VSELSPHLLFLFCPYFSPFHFSPVYAAFASFGVDYDSPFFVTRFSLSLPRSPRASCFLPRSFPFCRQRGAPLFFWSPCSHTFHLLRFSFVCHRMSLPSFPFFFDPSETFYPDKVFFAVTHPASLPFRHSPPLTASRLFCSLTLLLCWPKLRSFTFRTTCQLRRHIFPRRPSTVLSHSSRSGLLAPPIPPFLRSPFVRARFTKLYPQVSHRSQLSSNSQRI